MQSETWNHWIGDRWPFREYPAVNHAFDRVAARLELGCLRYLVPFFANISASYARWAYDLPASERYHHSYRFGLLIHSAETVDSALALSRDLMDRFEPVWHEVLIALALLHDCGRLFEVEVVDQRGGATWDPLQGPLDTFYRNGFVPLEDRFRWRPGRGIRTHEYRALDLQPLILGPYYEDEFELRIVDAWRKYFERVWKSVLIHDFYPYAVAHIVACADRQSVREDRLRQKTSAAPPDPKGTPPECYYSSLGRPSKIFTPPSSGGPRQ